MATALFAEKYIVPFVPIISFICALGSLVFFYRERLFGPSKGFDIFLVVESEDIEVQTTQPLYREQAENNSGWVEGDSSLKIRNYQCDLSAYMDYEFSKACMLHKTIDKKQNDEKGWYNLSHVKPPNKYDWLNQEEGKLNIESEVAVTKEELKENSNYFLLQVTEKFFDQIYWNDEQKIELISKEGNEKFASFKVLFAFRDMFIGVSTKYVLTKSPDVARWKKEGHQEMAFDLTTPSDKDGCYLFEVDAYEGKDLTRCVLNDFSQNIHIGEKDWYTDINHDRPLKRSNQITPSKFYIMELDNKYHVSKIKDMYLGYRVIKGDEKGTTLHFGKMYPVVVAGSKEKPVFFILTQN